MQIIRNVILSIKNFLASNKKVVENYFFMTILQFLSVFFSLFTYPFVVRSLGTEVYGLYAYAFSAVMIFGTFISFSFDLLATKEVSENIDNLEKKSEIVSSVIFARLLLFIVSFILLVLLSVFVSFVQHNFLLYLVCFAGNLSLIFSQPWYFQAIQKMKLITYAQLTFRIVSIPFILLYVKNKDDLIIFVSITVVAKLLGALSNFFYLLVFEKIQIFWVGFDSLKERFRVTLPMFFNSVLGAIKNQSITQIIGAYFGMHEVALYDLAKKIINIPLMLLISINSAIFPKYAKLKQTKAIRKIITYEYILGLLCIIVISLIGKWVVLFLGGEKMHDAYYLLMILSINILTWLVLGAYLNLVFVLNNRNDLLVKNQIVSLVSAFLFISISILFFNSIYIFVLALAVSGIVELIYCHWNYKIIFKSKGLYNE